MLYVENGTALGAWRAKHYYANWEHGKRVETSWSASSLPLNLTWTLYKLMVTSTVLVQNQLRTKVDDSETWQNATHIYTSFAANVTGRVFDGVGGLSGGGASVVSAEA